ncbi:hypothetical protein [Arthrobacter sp. CG_A4]|uniref:hypothetical protein n=1 Tax=Arthrobacter sp. CG_A4 TaxID=3071706 RepID=UPI002DFB6039|nr:hypothetical protein [Arthrobacter sp. CG_A4]
MSPLLVPRKPATAVWQAVSLVELLASGAEARSLRPGEPGEPGAGVRTPKLSR